MIRYVVRVKTRRDGTVSYEAIGANRSTDPQDAHLYTKRELAEKKANYYLKNTKVFSEVDIIPVTVVWEV